MNSCGTKEWKGIFCYGYTVFHVCRPWMLQINVNNVPTYNTLKNHENISFIYFISLKCVIKTWSLSLLAIWQNSSKLRTIYLNLFWLKNIKEIYCYGGMSFTSQFSAHPSVWDCLWTNIPSFIAIYLDKCQSYISLDLLVYLKQKGNRYLLFASPFFCLISLHMFWNPVF